jgi:uncharacterized Zn-binding protein involved in type VI secretion
MPQIARIGDTVSCLKGQTTIIGGSKKRAGGQGIARVGDATGCGCTISSGAKNVQCDGQQVAHVGSTVSCGGTVTGGCTDVSAS